MMGMTMPTQSALSDLSTLLQLLQVAADAKSAKATLDAFADAKAQYEEAIAKSLAQEKSAATALKRVELAEQKAQMAADQAQKRINELAQKATETQDEADALAQDQLIFNTYKAEIAKQALDNATFSAEQEAKIKAAWAEIEVEREALDDKSKVLDAAMVVNAEVRAEYEAKLAKLKALTQ